MSASTAEAINVYIDGSCINNGSPHAKAGYGVFFAKDDARNEYARVEGKQTNNTGELTAIIRALEILRDEIAEKRLINIFTDSEYVMKCAGSYGDKLAKNDWKTSTDKVPPNCKLLQKLHGLYKPSKKYIKLNHVKAHTNLQDVHSLGNEEADRLANLAVGNVKSSDTASREHAHAHAHEHSYDIDNDNDGEQLFQRFVKKDVKKHYISVTYDYKDAVKKLGAKWDMGEKKWYYEDTISDENKSAIGIIELSCINNAQLPPIIEETVGNDIIKKMYVKIPFQAKDRVKKLGGRWDPEAKSWYYPSNHDKSKIDSILKLVE
jgi:ribonuclease HI